MFKYIFCVSKKTNIIKLDIQIDSSEQKVQKHVRLYKSKTL